MGCEGGASENWKAKGARAPTGGPTARSSRMHTDRQSTQLARRKTKRERERGMTAQELEQHRGRYTGTGPAPKHHQETQKEAISLTVSPSNVFSH